MLERLRGPLSAEKSFHYALHATFAHWADEVAAPGQVPDELLAVVQNTLDTAGTQIGMQFLSNILEQQVTHSEMFQALITVGMERLGRIRNGDVTSATLNDFLSTVARAGDTKPCSVLDPACGYGGTLLAVDPNQQLTLIGIELDEDTAAIAEMRLLLNGHTNYEIRRGDSLRQNLDSRWDLVVSQPPFLPFVPRDSVSASFNDVFGSKPSVDGAAIWLRLISDSLTSTGRGVVVLPVTALRRNSGEVMTNLMRNDAVEALISIPAGLIPGTNVSALVVVLSSEKHSSRTGRFLVCNAADLAPLGQQPEVSSGQIVSSWLSSSELPACEEWQAKVIDSETYVSTELKSPHEVLPVPPAQQQTRAEPSSRGLSELQLGGFKSIDATTIVPLRPLTLIYGKNSAGKSSLIQSLLLLGQSVAENAFTASGEIVNLGSFQGLQHGHDSNRTLSIGVTWASSPEIDSPKAIPDPRSLRSQRFCFTTASTQAAGSPSSVSIGLGAEVFTLTHDRSSPESLSLSAEDVARLVALAYSEGSTYPPRNTSRNQGSRVARKFRQLGIDEIPLQRSSLAAGELEPKFSSEFDYRSSTSRTHKGLEHAALKRAAEHLGSVSDELANLLARLVYLGPLRETPKRFSQRQPGSLTRDMPFFLLDNDAERQAVSDWLKRLGAPYELEVVNPIIPEYRETVGEVATVALKDTRSGISVTPVDVGFGISQVLPILTELSARTNSIILIEQPEIHLHPAMQAELGDLLIESTRASGRGNQVIAETHSETLILRVQKRIREGLLAHSEVLVMYVDQDAEGKGRIDELRLDPDGNFIDSWPGGFFDEQFDELFGDL